MHCSNTGLYKIKVFIVEDNILKGATPAVVRSRTS